MHLGNLVGCTSAGNTETLIIKKIDRILKISDCIASFLSERNINPVFIVPGEANVHLLDSIGRHESLSFVCTQNEKKRLRGRRIVLYAALEPGGVGGLIGGGGCQYVPGVANAWVDSVPMLEISGQAQTDQDTDGSGSGNWVTRN